eukprot:COSAG06_NODE_8629_length_2110_cov_13.000995_3_plen_197_part_00
MRRLSRSASTSARSSRRSCFSVAALSASSCCPSSLLVASIVSCAGQLRFRCALLAQRLRSSYHPSLLLPLAMSMAPNVRAMLLAALLAPLPRRHAVILRPVLHRLPPRPVPLRSLRRVPCAAYPAPRPPRRVPCAASFSCRLSSPADAPAARPVLCCLSPLLPCCPSARRCRCPSPPPRRRAAAHRHHRRGYSKIF